MEISETHTNCIHIYSLEFLKQSKEESSFSFFQCFKFYVVVSQALKSNSNIRILFLKWLKQKYAETNNKINFTNESIDVLLKYFQFLLKILTKYKIVTQTLELKSSVSKKISNSQQTIQLSDNQIKTIIQLYTKTIVDSQLTVQLQLNSRLVLVTEHLINWFLDVPNFSFLKQRVDYIAEQPTSLKINNYISGTNIKIVDSKNIKKIYNLRNFI